MKHLSFFNSSLFRSLLCLGLVLSLLGGPWACRAEEAATVEGFRFDCQMRLNTENASGRSSHLLGYAALLEALRLQGSVTYQASKRLLDLQMNIIPAGSAEDAIDLRLRGYPDQLLLSSSLLRNETILFSNASLPEFAVKTYQHLGLSLQIPVLLVPYSYEFSFRGVANAWRKYFPASAKSRTISVKKIRSFANAAEQSLSQRGEADALLSTIALDSPFAETLQNELLALPAYLTETVTGGKTVSVKFSKGTETWRCGKRTLLTHTVSDTEDTLVTSLPPTKGGYTPVLGYMITSDGSLFNAEAEAAWAKEDGGALFRIALSGSGLPLRWPVACDARAALALSGDLFPGLYLQGRLQSDGSGQATFSVRWSREESMAHALELTGTLLLEPQTFPATVCTEEELQAGTDILRTNDVTLAEFVSRILRPTTLGLIHFLSGIPASACQSLMNDLSDTGVLDILLSGL